MQLLVMKHKTKPTLKSLKVFKPKPLCVRLSILNEYLHFFTFKEAKFLLQEFNKERLSLNK